MTDTPPPSGRQPIQWTDALLTGIAEVDDQHRILVSILNEARARMGSPGRAVFQQITRDLLAYALYHFETEEELMQRTGYAAAEPAEAALHLRQHRTFSRQVVALRAEAEADWMTAGEALLSFLEDWLTHHILTTDKRLGQWVGSAGAAP